MAELRTVDISRSDASTAAAVVEAAKTLGFVYITGHGIPARVLDGVWAASERLFALPEDEKRQYPIAADNRGWSRPGTETLDPGNQVGADLKEAWNLAIEHPPKRAEPPLLEEHAEELDAFKAGCASVVSRLCVLFGIGLGLEDPEYFSARHSSDRLSGTTLRLLHYPALTRELEAGEQRAGAHTDYGSMTLLFQKPGQSGLEISTADGNWAAVPPPPVDEAKHTQTSAAGKTGMESPPILVNIADQLQLWTSGVLKSTLHRVTSASFKGDRYSIAYFAHPDDDTILEPILDLQGVVALAEKQQDANTPLPTKIPLTAGDHLRARIAATYAYDKP